MRGRTYRLPIGRTLHRHLVRALTRAVDPARGYPLPALPRLRVARLETLLDVLEVSPVRQRAAWVDATRRDLSTLHAFFGWALRSGEVSLPPSARAVRRRAGWLIGLD